MSSTEDLDYPQILFQYNNGFLVSKIMFTACELGVFDLLLESEGSLSSDAIAEHLGTSVSGMERLLDACVGLKLLEVEMKSEGAFYRNTELSNLYLVKSSPKSQYHNLMYYSKTVYLCWHYLTDAVRDGKNQYERAFGVSSKDLFGALYRSEKEMIQFMYGLNAIWSICGRDVIAAFDLSPFTVIYDLGGCAGGLAQECISLYPKSAVTIYDLPKVVQVAKERFVPPEERRITFHEGGGVLLVETLLNEDKTGPLEAQLYSMNMLVQAEGKERTPTEYSKLLAAAGFREIQVKKTGKLYDAILGRK
ncbi:acetylserotonin O-methyltransferase-like isoform X2 [Gopherus flavomarginatus]|uniref:acetylserotonin O-methyltransferase-like isoform X2 n=1 Tax=Gopherus flavomarginatus TaxID=286002 RepID=UPI0021CBD09E|nr:acetylserotonin O-methyltransferase-like isoform X2 [Gopherus flavomarginatus]